MSGEACSATESTIGTVVVKNGFTALRYLKEGKSKLFDAVLTTSKNDAISIIENNRIRLFLILFSFLLIF